MAEIDHILPDGSFINELDSVPPILQHASPLGTWVEEVAALLAQAEIRPFVWVDT